MDDIDIIDICTPPMVHYGQIIAALKAGKHVVCEKPLVGSLKQIDEVMAVERESKGRLMPVFQYRFGNGIAQAKAIIDAGLAGKPYVGTVETLWRRDADYYAVPWRGKWATELGGVLMGHAIHTARHLPLPDGSRDRTLRTRGDARQRRSRSRTASRPPCRWRAVRSARSPRRWAQRTRSAASGSRSRT